MEGRHCMPQNKGHNTERGCLQHLLPEVADLDLIQGAVISHKRLHSHVRQVNLAQLHDDEHHLLLFLHLRVH